MGEKQPKKKPLVMDAIKPQGFSESSDETAEEKELDAIEAAVAEEMADTEEAAQTDTPDEAPAEETPKEPEAPDEPAEPAEVGGSESESEPESEEPAEEPEPEPESETNQEEPAEEPEAEPTVSGLEEDNTKNQEPQKETDAPTFAEQLEQTHEQNKDLSDIRAAAPKKERIIFKLLRILIWLFVAVMLPVSIFIMKNSEKAAAYANGTHNAQLSFGQTFFWITLIVGILNFIWGTVRWIMRIVRNHCSVGRIIGKLIGGGIWRFFVFAPIVLISLIFVAPAINNKIRNDVLLENQTSTDGRMLIEQDFKSGKISIDEYVKYSLDYMFSPSSLPEQYQDNAKAVSFDLNYDLIEEHLDELSDETKESLLNVLLPSNIDFDTDASSNVSKNTNTGIFTQNVSAVADNVSVLNKATTSPNEKVVVFYTDTGSDKISDETASDVAKKVEEKIDKAPSILGVSFDDYKGEYVSGSSKVEKIKNVLKANNIDENILEHAFPIFIVELEREGDDGTLAFHSGRKSHALGWTILYHTIALIDEKSRFENSLPVVEFIVLRPKYVNSEIMEEVSAHELGHALQEKDCVDHTGTYCKGNSDFVIEGTAQLFSTNTTKAIATGNDSFLDKHHRNYLRSTCNKADNIMSEDADAKYDCTPFATQLGYASTAFWENYYEIVPNAATIISNAILQDDPLPYLYEQAGTTNFRTVMKQLSQRNINPDDYSEQVKKAFHIYEDRYPVGDILNCTGLCTKQFQMAPASIKYIYLSTQSSVKTEISVQAPNSTAITMYKINGDANEKLTEGNGKAKYTSGSKAENIIIAVANGSIEAVDFIVTITPEEVKDIFEEKTIDFDIKNPFKELDNGCVEVDMDSLLDVPGEISGFIKGINSDIDFSNIIKQLDEVDKNKEETKQHFEGYIISICTIDFKEGTDFATARAKLKKIMNSGLGIINLDFYNSKSSDMNISVFGTIDTFDKSGKVYALIEIEKGMPGLFNINVDPR